MSRYLSGVVVLRSTMSRTKLETLRRFAAVAGAVGAALILGWGAAGALAASSIGAYTTKGAWSFVSAPSLHPPKLATDAPTVTGKLADGDFLLANFPNIGASGPMTGEGGPLIVDQRLQPVWFEPVGIDVLSADLQQESYLGQPVLVWWQGVVTRTGGTTSGEVVIVDQHYRRLATLTAKAPWVISLHDVVISGADIWVTVYRDVRDQNLAAYGGPHKGTVYDAGVQEYDLATGRLLYTWDALNPGRTPNVSLAESEQPAYGLSATGGVWDAYHLNSVQVLPGNEILVSMRNTWAAYLIDTMTGKIVWELGGKHSSFSFARGAAFQWQHDVQLLAGGEVSLFDDGCCKRLRSGSFTRPNGSSQGMLLRLDLAKRRVSLTAAYPHRPTFNTALLGSMQVLPDGNALVGWGAVPYFTEYARSGRRLLDVVFPRKDQSYRALFTSTWVGTPYYPPSGAVRKARGRTTIYASWNGATQVAGWEVLGGASVHDLAVVGKGRRTGFETAIALKKGGYSVFEVRALDARNNVLGTSKPF